MHKASFDVLNGVRIYSVSSVSSACEVSQARVRQFCRKKFSPDSKYIVFFAGQYFLTDVSLSDFIDRLGCSGRPYKSYFRG